MALTRRRQITERFSQAIDQLGSESPEIRLGAIYALERIAREDRDYHWPIIEILSTSVRHFAPQRDHVPGFPPTGNLLGRDMRRESLQISLLDPRKYACIEP
jgi:hypothetical protein